MALTADVVRNVRKGVLFCVGEEFTLQFDGEFQRTHREEYLMYLELLKKLRQHKFDTRRNAWTLPIAEDSIRCLNKLVGYGLSAATSAREKLGIELKKMADRDAIKQAATEEQIELTIPGAAALTAAMKNYQKGGVKFMAAVERAYIGDEMGLGKSLQILATLELKQAYPALIICPVKLKQNWLAECRKWLPHRKASMLANSMAEITILGYSEIHNYCNAKLASAKKKEREEAAKEGNGKRFFVPDIRKFDSVTCDEGHFIKTNTSRRTEAATCIAMLSESRVRIVASGTPIENGRPAEMIAPLTFLGVLDRFGGWFNFVSRYCGGKRTKFGWDTSGASNTREFYEKLCHICYIRRKKADVLKELPEKIQSIYDVELSNWDDYRRVEKDITAFMMQQTGGLLSEKQKEAQGLIKLGALRQVCGLGKVDWIVEWVNNFLESGEKFVLYAAHQEVQRRLIEALANWRPAVVIAGCKDVDAQVERFRLDRKCPLFIGSILAAGFGINGLQGVCSNVGLAELMWTDSKHQQVIDRVHRIGQRSCVNAYYFLARGTIDDDMWEVVTDKARINASTVDGEEGSKAAVLGNLVRRISDPNRTRN